MASTISRRRFLQVLGLGGASFMLRDFATALASRPRAASSDPLYLIVCTFEGGWDQMLALDPRDNTKFTTPSAAIFPAYSLLAANDPEIDQILTSNPSGIVRPSGSNLSFGPAVGRLADSALSQDLCIVRGINMGTLTHEVGRRYFLTGKFPRGLSASGSSLPTAFVDQSGNLSTIPNLVVAMETYNEGMQGFASGLEVRTSDDLQAVLTPAGVALADPVVAAINAYLGGVPGSCPGQRLDGNGQVSQHVTSRSAALQMVQSNLGALFDFPTAPTSADMQALYEAFHISSTSSTASAQLQGAAGNAMIAVQAITHGVSQAVSVRLATNIDTHDDTYLTDHAPTIRDGFDALADLVSYLKTVQHPDTGRSYWDHTFLLCTSDFARDPALNSRSGRDHHLASSCLVAGPGIKGNQVIGATDDSYMNALGIDLGTGAAQPSEGYVVRPPDVHATLLEAMGLSADHLANQSPQLIRAMLKG